MDKVIAVVGGMVAGVLCYKCVKFCNAVRDDMQDMVTEEEEMEEK